MRSYSLQIITFLLCGLMVSLQVKASSNGSCTNKCASHTFFRPAQVTFDSTFELALTNYHIYHHDAAEEPTHYFYASPFVQRSTKPGKLGQFFSPRGKCNIEFRQDGSGDVDPIWLNLIAQGGNYSSTISLRPQRTTYGAVFHSWVDLSHFCDGLWASGTTAAMGAEHSLRLCERGGGNGSIAGFPNAASALNNPAWVAGRFSRCKLHTAGLDDIQLKFGYNYFFCDDNHISPYVVLGIPTGRQPLSEFIFEPLVGSRNVSLGVGVNADYELYRCDDHVLTGMLDVKYRYVFSACERRSFDLKNGDWSRFLLLVTQSACVPSPACGDLGAFVQLQPAINVLTQTVRVTPRSTIDLWAALHWEHACWNAELGYNLWWRDAEKISCAGKFNLDNLGIFDISSVPDLLDPNNIGCCANLVTASTATISQGVAGANKVVPDATFTLLTQSQVNLCSAAHPRALSNKIYGAASYNSTLCETPALFGLGVSYEFANRNALSQWALWGSFGISF